MQSKLTRKYNNLDAKIKARAEVIARLSKRQHFAKQARAAIMKLMLKQ